MGKFEDYMLQTVCLHCHALFFICLANVYGGNLSPNMGVFTGGFSLAEPVIREPEPHMEI